MIINTGMRTDIPAFYSKWLLNRIKEGFVMVRNPYYKNQVTKYSLNPEVVDCLAFCTKNPHLLIPHLSELDTYKQFWFVTITPYGKDIEPNVPDKKKVISDFKKLSEHLGKNAVAIRYDPILINEKFDVDMHIRCFGKLLSELKGYTEDCTISFLDAYNTCMHLCKYCYANANQGMVRENIKKHNPDSPFLIGELEEEDKVTEANQKSWLDVAEQISFI